MAKTTFDTIRRGISEWMAFPEELEIDPALNGRHDTPDLEPLIASILQHGQIQPVSIRKTGGKPMLTAGFSRYRAISAINERELYPVKPLKIRCSYTALTETQAFVANIHENHVRNQTTPVDDAYNIQRLINIYQYSEQAAADVYSQNVAWIRSRLQLLELTPEAESAVRSGRVKENAATVISKLSAAQQRKVLKGDGPITRKSIKAVVEPKPAKMEPIAAKPSMKDPEMLRLCSKILEDVEEVIRDEEMGLYVDVDRKSLIALSDYIKETY